MKRGSVGGRLRLSFAEPVPGRGRFLLGGEARVRVGPRTAPRSQTCCASRLHVEETRFLVRCPPATGPRASWIPATAGPAAAAAAGAAAAAAGGATPTGAVPAGEAVAWLTSIPGVSRRTAEVVVAESGADLGTFPTAGHLASWAGWCPGNHESAGKRQSGRTRRGNRWRKQALVPAAWAATRGKRG